MRSIRAALSILALATLTIVAGPPGMPQAAADEPAPATPAPATLYKRLGGFDSLAVLTDDFMARLIKDPSLSRFFAGYSDESRGRIRQLVLDQLCAASGGPCLYIGRDMKTAHKGLGIRESDWAATVGHLIATLDKANVAQKEKFEVLAIVASLKKDIVEKP